MFPRKGFILLSLILLLAGCASTSPYVGRGPHSQVSRGHKVPPVDFLGNVLSLPGKLILWNWSFNNHNVSEETEAVLTGYLDARNRAVFEDTQYRIDQYSPIKDIKSLIRNKHVAWPYRLIFGLPITLIYDVLLPGRLFPWGDYFNPYTNTAHLYSDDPTISLHEAGHAYDFSVHPYRGTYSVGRILPVMDLFQEWAATDEAIKYLREIGDRETELRAYKTLWPAYGTYFGGYVPVQFGSYGGALVGHIAGRYQAKSRKEYYERMDFVFSTPHSYLDDGGLMINNKDKSEGVQ
jgi:hypothetical protein